MSRNASDAKSVSSKAVNKTPERPGRDVTLDRLDAEDREAVQFRIQQIRADMASGRIDVPDISNIVTSTQTNGITQNQTIDNTGYAFSTQSELAYMKNALECIANSLCFTLGGNALYKELLSEEEIGLAIGMAAAKAELYAEQSGFGDYFNNQLKQATSNMIEEYLSGIKARIEMGANSSSLYATAYTALDEDSIFSIMERTKTALLADDGGESFDRLFNEIRVLYQSKSDKVTILRGIVYASRRADTITATLEEEYGKATKDALEEFFAEKMGDSQSKQNELAALTREIIAQEISKFVEKHNIADTMVELMIRGIYEQNWLKRASSQLTSAEADKVAQMINSTDPMALLDLVERGSIRYWSAGSAGNEYQWDTLHTCMTKEWNTVTTNMDAGCIIPSNNVNIRTELNVCF